MSIDVATSHQPPQSGLLEQILRQAIVSHHELARQLAAAVSAGQSPVSVEVASADNRCAFGRWLYEDVPWRLRKTWDYASVRKRHAEFHLQAGHILDLALQGQAGAATDAMYTGTPFHLASEQLDLGIMDWLPRVEGQANGTKA